MGIPPKKIKKHLKNVGLELDNEVTEDDRFYLDKGKIKELLLKLGKFLNFDDLMEIKKQINKLSKDGRSLPIRLNHMENRKEALKKKYQGKESPLSKYVVEQPSIVILLCLM